MTNERLIEIPVFFYRTSVGVELVLDWLRRLPAEDRRAIGADLSTVQMGWPIGMPLCSAAGRRIVGSEEQPFQPAHCTAAVFAEGGRIGDAVVQSA